MWLTEVMTIKSLENPLAKSVLYFMTQTTLQNHN